jgi:alkanesulfonate monooxygenase SsuD/methylene tetrahydromethanopterin reductase-like flavin-dependent oxidoreductase (luciferase family)
VELGLTRSTIPEWRLFGIEPDDARAQTQQAFEMVPKMWTSERFSWRSRHFEIDDVPIVPHPYQKPHPPLWQACSSPASFVQAGHNGVGALGVTLWSSRDQVRDLIGLYRRAIQECTQPVGQFVNDRIAFFTFVHCTDSDEAALWDAASAAAWYTNTAFTFFEAKDHFIKMAAEQQAVLSAPPDGSLIGDYLREQAAAQSAPNAAQLVIARIMGGQEVPAGEVFEALNGQDSLVVGTPDDCRRKLAAFADLGIDRLMCLQQMGRLPHDAVMGSIARTGALIAEFD